jgi:hypothetical protein
MNRDPQNDAEWQEAVNAAHFLLCLDAARQYGLVTGGPEIDIDRCLTIVERGQVRGFVPTETGDAA